MSIEELVAALFGPWGAAIGLLILTLYLARDHIRHDRRTESQLERAEGVADTAVAGWREQTTASAKSAEGNEASARAIEAIRAQLEAETAPTRRRAR